MAILKKISDEEMRLHLAQKVTLDRDRSVDGDDNDNDDDDDDDDDNGCCGSNK